jgi:hypothetical protein
LRKAIELEELSFGKDSPEVESLMCSVADALDMQGKWAEAERIYETEGRKIRDSNRCSQPVKAKHAI